MSKKSSKKPDPLELIRLANKDKSSAESKNRPEWIEMSLKSKAKVKPSATKVSASQRKRWELVFAF